LVQTVEFVRSGTAFGLCRPPREMSDQGAGSGDEFDYTPPVVPLPDGVQKDVIVESKTPWRKPQPGDKVKVHYVGTLEDGTLFDSSRERGAPIEFTLDRGEVIKGWDLGIATMSKGETSKLTIQPEYAYGEEGQPPTIPPSAVLIFEVELISWIANDDLFGDEGCLKSTTKEGSDPWNNPSKGSEVRLTFKTTTKNGTLIEERFEIDYIIGNQSTDVKDPDVARVIDKALKKMSREETCVLKCTKDYVYKGAGHGAVAIELTLHEIYNTTDVSFLKDGTVMKKCIKEGEGHEHPDDGNSVHLRVTAARDGSGADLPRFKGPVDLKFRCCEGEVCDAIEGASRELKRGEKALLTCMVPWKIREAKLGLKDVDVPKVVLELELVDFVKGKDVWARTDEDKVELALNRKETATELFKAKRFEMALDKYKKVLDTIGSHDGFHEDLKKGCAVLKRTIELNKAACYLQLNDPTSALTSCNIVLREDRNNLKALFRRAKAHHARTEHIEAAADLERLLELEPSNSEAKALLPHVRRAQKIADKASRNTFAKMCEGFGSGRIDFEERKKKEEPQPTNEPEEPEQDPEIVRVSFKIEYKPEGEEKLYVVGTPEEIGNWDTSKAVAMEKLPLKWEPPTGSGKAPPEHHFWEAVIELPQSLGRFEYQYVMKGLPQGDRQEEGSKHKCDLTGMGGSRVRCADSWRGPGA